MDKFIKAAVDAQSDLKLKVNIGEIHRIMKNRWNGSLWILKTETLGYRVETTGSVGTHLNRKIKNLLGRDRNRVSEKGYYIWYVDTPDEVKKIIEIYGQI